MLRCTISAFKDKTSDKNLLAIFVASMIGVGVFYGPGLMYGEHTSLTIMEYWRWWVVHLWVEGFFEVFATASTSLYLLSMGLVSQKNGHSGFIEWQPACLWSAACPAPSTTCISQAPPPR